MVMSREVKRRWYARHRKQINVQRRQYRIANRERVNEVQRNCYKRNRVKRLAAAKMKTQDLRKKALTMYGSACWCCLESIQAFLGFDHINGGGKAHRKVVGEGQSFYRWLLKKWRDEMQILCHNCNLAKGFYGRCPHETN